MENIEHGTRKPTNKIRGLMTWDHMRLEKFLSQFQFLLQSKPQEAAAAFSEFEQRLKRHFMWEEDILFPLYETSVAFRKETGPENFELTSAIRDEHRELKDLLRHIEVKLTRGELEVADLTLRLTYRLKEHQEKEEHILYSWIDDTVSQEIREEAMKKITHELVNP